MIDSHLHIWELERFEYSWITPDSPTLFCDYTLEKALAVLNANKVNNAVLVEAHSSLEENRWLLEIAESHPQILGVIGWCDLASPTLVQDLEPMLYYPKFKGVRPRIPSAQAPSITWQALHHGLDILEKYHLTCDLLIQDHLSLQLHQLISLHPRVTFVFNHFAGIQFAPEYHASWAVSLEDFANLSHVCLKVSGFLTAAKNKPLEPDVFALFFQTALGLFGENRLIFGSDYPVCTLAGQYQDTIHKLLEQTTSELIFQSNAERIYRLITP